MDTHITYGDFTVDSSPDYGPGNLRVRNDCVIEGDLTVLGDTVNQEVETVITTDALLGLNNQPSIPDRDGGLSMEIHPNNLVVTESGTVVSATTNTVTFPTVASDYVGWKITITGGTGSGQIRSITSNVVGVNTTATVDDWVVVPDGSSTYDLARGTHSYIAYDSQVGQYFMGRGPEDHTNNKLSKMDLGTLLIGNLIQANNQEQVAYVGKHGNDGNSGLTIGEAKLTVASALGVSDEVIIMDGGSYDATIGLGKRVWGPHCTINNLNLTGELVCKLVSGSVTMNDGKLVCEELIGDIDCPLSGGSLEIEIDKCTSTTVLTTASDCNIMVSGNCTTGVIAQLNSEVNVSGETLNCVTGFEAQGTSTIVVRVDNLNCTQVADTGSTGVVLQLSSNSTGEVDLGSGTYKWLDVERGHDHIISTANPHSVTIDQVSPLTTKGDLLVHNGVGSIRLPVGIDGYCLVADSSNPNGVDWITQSVSNNVVIVSAESKKTFAINETFEIVASIPDPGLVNGSIIFNVAVVGAPLEILVQSGIVLAQQTIAVSGNYNIPLLLPTSSTIDIYVRKTTTASAPEISGIYLRWGVSGGIYNQSKDWQLNIVNPPSYVVQSTDYTIFVNTTSPSTIVLPIMAKRELRIVDQRGTAGTNPITIVPQSGDSINGLGSYVINTNFGSAIIISDLNNWYVL
jgi:hypothetical protein